MKKIIILSASVFLFCMSFVASQFAYSGIFEEIDQVMSPLKSITNFDRYLLVEGRWKKISSTSKAKGNKPPKINTVHIVCDKGSMSCWETIAELATPQDVGFGEQTFLHINQTGYKIIEWSQDLIYAKNTEYRVSDFELRIILKNSHAERYRRETRARGCSTCDPDIFEKWIIE
jgi:hypothetical protein